MINQCLCHKLFRIIRLFVIKLLEGCASTTTNFNCHNAVWKQYIGHSVSDCTCCNIQPHINVQHLTDHELDVHGSVHHNTNLIEMTNKMQLCRTIYYSTVP
jgi:hypothetical protein